MIITFALMLIMIPFFWLFVTILHFPPLFIITLSIVGIFWPIFPAIAGHLLIYSLFLSLMFYMFLLRLIDSPDICDSVLRLISKSKANHNLISFDSPLEDSDVLQERREVNAVLQNKHKSPILLIHGLTKVFRKSRLFGLLPSDSTPEIAVNKFEENVWKLCEYIANNESNCLNDCFVVFISNEQKMIPLWRQKAGDERRDYLCVWDYHVFIGFFYFCFKFSKYFHSTGSHRALVYDMDSTLEFSLDFSTYSGLTFRDETAIRDEYHRRFRVIEAQIYLTTFASNRSHMRRPDDSWIKDPPLYPCIKTNECDHNLDGFISMDCHRFAIGSVLDINQFNHQFDPKS
ncbi:unnamed protein product [Medioppia subpectinata]|uniref:Protein N-terminal glutamine amidohydrolase n=1 Tax=Medioppia subpectinata TaxID=1979941 RepID=A0A7R9PWG4_9ACAR|nr:unnamed protein product [Medioppia subpectinata]CAG2103908.1 unnamed protein product [Medioppia subpectinata]